MILLRAGCKINLGLRITGRRPDGYHELDSLFLPLPLPRDDLILRPLAEDRLVVRCGRPDVDAADNTLTRAWAAFREMGGAVRGGLEVGLVKRIPSGAGLGGGSADAAVLLNWLNGESPAPLPPEDLERAALRVGADVSFFLRNVPCRVRGIGDILEPEAPDLRGFRILLAWPGIHVSTPWAYRCWDAASEAAKSGESPQKGLTGLPGEMYKIRLATEARSRARTPVPLRNDLEDAVVAAHPRLASIRSMLEDAGGAAAMSGSGSAMYALFAPEIPAGDIRRCADALRGGGARAYLISVPSCWDVAKRQGNGL